MSITVWGLKRKIIFSPKYSPPPLWMATDKFNNSDADHSNYAESESSSLSQPFPQVTKSERGVCLWKHMVRFKGNSVTSKKACLHVQSRCVGFNNCPIVKATSPVTTRHMKNEHRVREKRIRSGSMNI